MQTSPGAPLSLSTSLAVGGHPQPVSPGLFLRLWFRSFVFPLSGGNFRHRFLGKDRASCPDAEGTFDGSTCAVEGEGGGLRSCVGLSPKWPVPQCPLGAATQPEFGIRPLSRGSRRPCPRWGWEFSQKQRGGLHVGASGTLSGQGRENRGCLPTGHWEGWGNGAPTSSHLSLTGSFSQPPRTSKPAFPWPPAWGGGGGAPGLVFVWGFCLVRTPQLHLLRPRGLPSVRLPEGGKKASYPQSQILSLSWAHAPPSSHQGCLSALPCSPGPGSLSTRGRERALG